MTNQQPKSDNKPLDEGQLMLREVRRKEMSEMKFGQQGGSLMIPTDGRDLQDKANLLSGAGPMVKEFYRGNPGACAALIMICAPYGINPFQASWKTYKASSGQDAPISFESQIIVAMINIGAPIKGKLKYEYTGEGNSRACKVTGVDRDSGDALTYESPPKEAIRPQNSPLWKTDPDQQLAYYSARAWCRRHYPEMLMGVYDREELIEEPKHQGPTDAKDVTPAIDRLKERLRKAAGPVAEELWKEPGDDLDEPVTEQEKPQEAQVEDPAPETPREDESAPDGGEKTDGGLLDTGIEDAEVIGAPDIDAGGQEDEAKPNITDDGDSAPALSPEDEARILAEIEAEREREMQEITPDDEQKIADGTDLFGDGGR